MAFIVIEGMDGAGKTTQTRLLKEKLEKENLSCFLTREPGGTVIGQRIREILLDPEHEEMSPETELFLYMASRCQLVSQEIRPALEEGKVVIADRFLLSSLVYQGMVGEVGVEKVNILGNIATQGVEPDRIFILHVPVAVGVSRLPRQRQFWDRMELKGLEYMKKVQKAYLEAAKNYPQAQVINATLSVEEVHQQIVESLKDVLQPNHRS